LLDLGVITSLDSLALTEAASIAAELERCRYELNQVGMTITGHSGSIVANPLCGVANQLRGSLYKYLTQLGLTPRSRTGIDVSPREIDPLDGL
jgi:P27 family predicted phage terminase small subunit